jgi:predicted 3-demethylubiquinone-9 3-methyltransferase (glyoxalase superfamily)
MQKITPFLWFDTHAEEAMTLYVSLFRDAAILEVTRSPEGKVMTGVFQLEGRRFMALDGGPSFKPTPAISFFMTCPSAGDVDALYEGLSAGGSVLMPLEAYPWSPRYAWVQDRYGVSWQLAVGEGERRLAPALLFSAGPGKADEAMRHYTSIFEDSRILHVERYGPGEPGPEGSVKYAAFQLHGQPFLAMDSPIAQPFTFTEGTSFLVDCRSQDEVDRFWERLSDGGQTSQCGWLKDRFGVSWQVIPAELMRLLRDPDRERSKRAMDAMLQMTKIDIEALRRA